MFNGTLTLGPPTTNTSDVSADAYCEQPGMPITARLMPGLCCTIPRIVAPMAVPAGMFEVARLMLVRVTGRADAANASGTRSTARTENPPGSDAERSRLPGSPDGPPGE